MNLSKKQLEVLVDEIYLKDVYPLMQKQVNELEEKLRKDLYTQLEHIKNEMFNINFIGFKYFVIEKKTLLDHLWYSYYWNVYSTDTKDFNGLIQSLLNDIKRAEYDKIYKKEITKSDIERIIILETIWAKNVEELIEAVTNKLSLS